MAGIYIHIPFCRQACHYCNFHFSTSLKLQNDFLDALLKEMILQKNYVAGEPVDTIYFGGGTPSLLTATALSAIMETIYSTYTIADTAEITFEANPDDISESNLQLWKKSGINRLSIGVQSFFDEDLIWMNRAHTASQANDSIMRAQDAGFVNMSIDLIYGTPGLSDSKWADNMQHAA
jgi:oxygen-independent coproporphyrinogen-3 oxidase